MRHASGLYDRTTKLDSDVWRINWPMLYLLFYAHKAMEFQPLYGLAMRSTALVSCTATSNVHNTRRCINDTSLDSAREQRIVE